MIRELYNKYKEPILYVFFGGCTTLVNILSYYLCAHFCDFNTTLSTVISWVVSVIFAYVTNKQWVFKSEAKGFNQCFKEVVSFFGFRLSTGVMDLIIMVVFVDFLFFNDLIIKIISNVIVVVVNYFASKLVVFK